MNKPALVYLKDLQKNLNDLIEEHENKLEYIEPESFKDDINENNIKSWQKHLAHVPQSIYLSDTSIYENIAFGIQ